MIPYIKSNFLIILISPSGGGKSTIARVILQEVPGVAYSISYTTRLPRGTEVNGKDYYFVSEDEFIQRKKTGEFLETANVHGHYYGTSREKIQNILNSGQHAILDIDVQGALQIRKGDIDNITIFILPPSEKILKERLVKRATDSSAVIEKRLTNARQEISYLHQFDYLVINDRLEEAVNRVTSIIRAEECRLMRYNKIDETFYGGK